MSVASEKPFTGLHLFWWIIGFFAVIIGVNATMATLALSTFNGVSEEQAYVDGLAFNQTLDAIAEQRALGWSVDTQIDRPGNLAASIRATYLDKSDIALTNLVVHAEFVRPVHQGYDFSVPLYQTAPGTYTATAEVPLSGQWMVRLVAERQESNQQLTRPYVLEYRTVVR